MRTRALVAAILLVAPVALTAQLRLPRRGRGGAQPQPAPLPPAAPGVAQALAYKRSRWSAEGYSMVSTFRTPTGAGISNFTTFGAGTHADYRFQDHWSGTMDVAASLVGGPSTSETIDVGTRYKPLALDADVRPFFDVRAGYMNMYDAFASPTGPGPGIGGAIGEFAQEQRYSRGFGGIGGAGFEVSLTRSIALSTELAAMRDRMTTYRLNGPASFPNGNTFWMTSLRYIVGLRFNPVTALHELR